MAALFGAGEGVADAGGGIAGGVDDHLDAVGGDQRHRVLGDPGGAGLQRVGDGMRFALLDRPACGGQGGAGARAVQIGDPGDMHPGGEPRLREEHGAELAGADQADAHGVARGGAGGEALVEVHRMAPGSVQDGDSFVSRHPE